MGQEHDATEGASPPVDSSFYSTTTDNTSNYSSSSTEGPSSSPQSEAAAPEAQTPHSRAQERRRAVRPFPPISSHPLDPEPLQEYGEEEESPNDPLSKLLDFGEEPLGDAQVGTL